MELIKIGQKLNIILNLDTNDNDTNDVVEMTCKITGYKKDRIELELPGYFMRYIKYLQPGNKFTSKVFTKLGTIDFNSVIIISPEMGQFTIEFDPNAYNLVPSSNAQIGAVEDLYITKNGNRKKYKTFEISMTHLGFNSYDNFEKGERFDCELVLPKNYGIIKIGAILNEVDIIYDTEYKIVYSTISEEDRNKLLYYLYLYSINAD